MKKSILTLIASAQIISLLGWAQSDSNPMVPMDPPASMAKAGLIPNPDISKAPSNDPFFGYQWGLLNNGQSYIPKLGDLYLDKPLASNPAIQIGWKNFDSQMKKDIVVAVLDSGIYTSTGHPDLKGVLLPGKNFVEPNSKVYDDLMGHGTHIAGIIAANINNAEGISGLSNKIKILPLKVIDVRAGQKTDDPKLAAIQNLITPRVVKAIEYAIEQKVDVIQLSLGWPRVQDHPVVHQAFEKAFKAGIVIVAASGNDGHDAQIFPCAYKEVLCVGAIALDGSLAPFSNYGGHVDLLAPGQGILSTIPPTISSQQFGPKGYDIKNGTSQSAPFVSGAAAILKGLYPNETAIQIRNRLLLGAQKISADSGFGLLNIEKSASLKSTTMARALTKEIEDAVVDAKTLQFQFPVTVESTEKNKPKVQVRSLDGDAQILSLKEGKPSGSFINYIATAKVSSMKRDHGFKYEITVNGKTLQSSLILKIGLESLNVKSYALSQQKMIQSTGLLPVSSPYSTAAVEYWSFARNTEQNSLQVAIFTLANGQMVEKSVELADVEKPVDGFNLIGSDDLDFDGKPDYLLLTVTNVGKAGEKAEMIYMDQNLNVKHRFAMDFDITLPFYKNIKDIVMVRTSMPNGKPLKTPLFRSEGKAPKADLMTRFATPEERKRASKGPVSAEDAIASRGLPITETNPDGVTRIYYYQPTLVGNDLRMATRTLTSPIASTALGRTIYETKVRTIMSKPAIKALLSANDVQLALDTDTFPILLSKPDLRKLLSEEEVQSLLDNSILKNLIILAVFPQSNAETARGQLDLLASHGRGVNVQLYRVQIQDVTSRFTVAKVIAIPNPEKNMARHLVQDVTSISPRGLDTEIGLSTLYSFLSGRTLLLRGTQIGGLKFELTDRHEAISFILKSFSNEKSFVSFADTTKYMRAKGTWNGMNIDAKAPIYRSGFLPGYSFSQRFEPIIVSNSQMPGVLIDSSDIFSNSVMIYAIENDGQMRSSIERSIDIPQNCHLQRKSLTNDQNFSRLAFTCLVKEAGQTEGKVELRLVDLQ